jgi:hypothetical protein
MACKIEISMHGILADRVPADLIRTMRNGSVLPSSVSTENPIVGAAVEIPFEPP